MKFSTPDVFDVATTAHFFECVDCKEVYATEVYFCELCGSTKIDHRGSLCADASITRPVKSLV